MQILWKKWHPLPPYVSHVPLKGMGKVKAEIDDDEDEWAAAYGQSAYLATDDESLSHHHHHDQNKQTGEKTPRRPKQRNILPTLTIDR